MTHKERIEAVYRGETPDPIPDFRLWQMLQTYNFRREINQL